MKAERKILYAIIVVLTMSLITCILLLNRKKQETDFVPNTTQLLYNLTDLVCDDIDKTLGDYVIYEWIEEDIDSFNIYAKKEPYYQSNEFKRIVKECALCDEKLNNQLFSLLNSISDTQSKEFEFLKALTDFVFITRLQRNELKNYTLFGGVAARVTPQKDTISKGEEYVATIEYAPDFFDIIPIMIVDGDTVSARRNSQLFKETPQKSGHVKHECTITFNQQGSIMNIPFTIEYYVK